MIVKSHSPENRRVPKRDSDPLCGIVNGIRFGLVAWAILGLLAYWVSGAMQTPGNPFYEVVQGGK